MKQNDYLTLVVPFFIVILIWIVFSVYHNSVTSTIPETLNLKIDPISPTFDEKAIGDLKKRENLSPTFEGSISTPSSENQSTSGGTINQ